MYSSKTYKDWVKHAEWALVGQVKGRKIAGEYTLEIAAVRPDKRRRDLGNLEKAVSDLLQKAGIIQDDYLCQDIHLHWAKSGPECLIIVKEYTDGTGQADTGPDRGS
jgi:crossover junction endodeoxyribonuclease RusA